MFNQLQEKIDNFPQELKDQRRWCNWRNVERGGRKTKMPISSLAGGEVKSNDESAWADFETAKKRIAMDTGIGYFFKEPYVGVDLDDVEDEVKRHLAGDFEDNIVSEFIHELDSYTEVSPSGTGIHIIIKGKLPEKGRRRGGIEMYDATRYFTVTFNSIGPNHIADDTDVGNLTKLHAKYIKKKETDRPDPTPSNENTVGEHGLSDKEVISRAGRSKQGEKFTSLLKGNWGDWNEYPSQSEADLAFANMLAFWTAKDKEQMDRIVRESGLYRNKWDEMRGHDTYGNIVIQTAVEEVENVYSPMRSKVFKPTNSETEFVYKEEVRQDAESFPVRTPDDTGNAKRLIDRFGDIIRYSYNRNKFYIYDGQVWKLDDTGAVDTFIDTVVEAIEEEDWGESELYDPEAQEKENEKINNSKAKHLRSSRSNHSKTSMKSQSKHQIPVTPDEFDADGILLNTEDGYVNLTTGVNFSPDKDKMFSMMTATINSRETSEPKAWLKFLDETFEGDQEMIKFLQRCVGYTLTGSVREEVMFVLHGNGQNGKSKFVEAIRAVMGTYTNNIQAKTLMVRSTETINNDIAKLQKARMVTSSEPSEGFVFDEGLIKQLTGGDQVTARFLFGEEFDFHPEFKLWLTTNVKPIIRGTDDGIWRRILLIPFERKVPENERDNELLGKLLKDSEGILQWAIEGCLAWQEVGLQVPKKVTDASKVYRNEMDIISQFIEDECETGQNFEERGSILFTRYKDWADYTVNNKLSKNKFGQKLKEKFEHKKKSDGIYYQGLRMKD